ncbi:MAG TPA: Rrf2 family transcriptional regulator [Fervidobacterium sp.]|nr:Rrf2 family transcriptional regulator [Fervidobacterium sp.]
MKSEYAIRLMMLLGISGRRMKTHELIETCKDKLPLKFTEKILADLARKGLLKAFRGHGGGYELAKSSDIITVYDIVSAVDNPSDMIKCFINTNKLDTSAEACTVNAIWETILHKMEETLKSITLKDLIKDYEARCNT